MSDIVERLHNTLTGSDGARQTLNEAADEIERLRAENKKLAKSRDKWGQLYNKTLAKLRAAVWTDTEYVKAVDEKCETLVHERDEAIREVSRLGRELGTEQARLAEAVEVVRAVVNDFDDLTSESDGVYGLHLNGDSAPWAELCSGGVHEEWTIGVEKARAFLAKEGRSDAIRAMEEKP